MKKESIFTLVFTDRVSLILTELLCKSIINNKYPWGKINNGFIFIKNGKEFEAHWGKEDIKNLDPDRTMYFLNKKNIINLSKKYDELYNEFKKGIKFTKNIDFNQLKIKEIIKFFKNYINFHKEVFTFYMATNPGTETEVVALIKNKLSKYYKPEKVQEIYNIIIESPKPSPMFLEESAILKLALKDKLSDLELFNHALNYPIYFINIYEEKDIIDFLRKKILKTKKTLKRAINEYKENKIKYKIISRKQKYLFRGWNDKDIEFYAQFIQRMGIYRLEQKEVFYGWELIWLKMFKKISELINVEVEELVNIYTSEEILNFLLKNKKLNNRVIKERKKCVACLIKNKRLYILSGKRATDFIEKELEKPELAGNIIEGLAANRGSYTGEAYIMPAITIKNLRSHIKAFKNGQVLISDITQPNMVLFAKKAGAIVTNQGGVACHAAIISRELNKPCVIGTKIATKVLKNGDIVEVNGDKGFVKIIK